MFSPCILLIDDDINRLTSLEAALTRVGYRVLTAHDSRQGVYLAQAVFPEVILCDATLPSRTDFDIKGMLAEDAQTASIPFIWLNRSLDKYELVARVNAIIRS